MQRRGRLPLIRKIVTKGRETRIRNLLNKAKNKGLTEIERKWLRSLQEKSESP